MTREPSSLVLVARWLDEEVGEGAIFTKQALRSALPQFEQVDRRMRDLRAYGWRIDTNREDAQLLPSELRLVHIGSRPGEPGFRAPSTRRVSAKERLAAISGADFRCQLCGIQLGERDDSESGSASLKVAQVADGLLVVCGMCAQAAPAQARMDLDRLRGRLSGLTVDELRQFRQRVADGRYQSGLEAALALAVRIPTDVAIRCADDGINASSANVVEPKWPQDER